MDIRPARRSDLADLVSIYNHYIRTTAFTFDIEPYTAATRSAWFDAFDGYRRQCFVADAGGRITGYGCSGEFKAKAAYATSVEVSIYIAPDQQRRGIASALYEALFAAIAPHGVHRAYAGITQPNEPSVALHRAFGFEQVARYEEVGFKFDRFWDVIWMQKRFES